MAENFTKLFHSPNQDRRFGTLREKICYGSKSAVFGPLVAKICNFGGGSKGPLGVAGAPWELKVANLGQNSHLSHSKTQNGQKSAVISPLVVKISKMGALEGVKGLWGDPL